MRKVILFVSFFVLVLCSIVEFGIYLNFQRVDIETSIPQIKENVPKISKEHYEATLFMVGDALYHDGVYKDGKQSDGTYSFLKNLELMQPIIKQYDLAYYNQESILGGTNLGLSTYPRFNSPQEVGDAFIASGFNLVSTANNHTLDRGEEAILRSYSYWKGKEDVVMAGTCDSFLCQENIPIFEKNHISFAFLSYTTTTNGLSVPKGKDYLVNLYSEERVFRDISKVKDQVDVILVAMHWGNEYQDYPNESQKQIANYLASLGVNIVIGTHPHVIQPIEQIGDTLVFYSLGNFISAQNGIHKLVGLAPNVTITKDIVGDQITIVNTSLAARLTYTYYNKRYRDFKVIPFSSLDSSILSNYEVISNQKKQLVESYDIDIEWLT